MNILRTLFIHEHIYLITLPELIVSFSSLTQATFKPGINMQIPSVQWRHTAIYCCFSIALIR